MLMDLKKICNDVIRIAGSTGEFITNESDKFHINQAVQKGLHDYVSYVDLEAEKKLVKELSGIIPDAAFITEEGTIEESSGRYRWIIDPLDGTTNFIHGIPAYSISIALADNNDIQLGVILDVSSGEMFWAYKNGGAWLNDNKISVSEAEKLEDSLIATGFPFKDYNSLSNYMNCLEYFISNTQGVRRIGSAAIDLAYVACGRFDAFFEYGLNIWDVAAGIVIITEAGGIVSDYSGNREKLNGKEMIASNNSLYDTFSREVIRFMK